MISPFLSSVSQIRVTLDSRAELLYCAPWIVKVYDVDAAVASLIVCTALACSSAIVSPPFISILVIDPLADRIRNVTLLLSSATIACRKDERGLSLMLSVTVRQWRRQSATLKTRHSARCMMELLLSMRASLSTSTHFTPSPLLKSKASSYNS